jgi:hypothetical protein
MTGDNGVITIGPCKSAGLKSESLPLMSQLFLSELTRKPVFHITSLGGKKEYDTRERPRELHDRKRKEGKTQRDESADAGEKRRITGGLTEKLMLKKRGGAPSLADSH